MGWDLQSVSDTLDSSRHGGAAPIRPPRERGRLTAVFPRGFTAVLDLGPDRLVVGRATDDPAAAPLPHPTVSRAHFALEWDPAQSTHVGMDLGSRNGSWVNGHPARTGWHPLDPGTVLRLGDVILVYEAGHTLSEPDASEVSRTAIPGDALAVRRLRSQIARAAPDISPALVLGETGTGKEEVARELHVRSGRTGAFVAVNCATLGEQLVESQLFGHKRGAFTGATTDRDGLFRAAEGGTLFLDEIGEMPLPLQPKLLRAIQEREVRPLGSTRTEQVDVRVVSATHQDLRERIGTGTFRQDLYARLALWELEVPAVRERRTDVLTWLEHLTAAWAEARGRSPEPIPLHVSAAERLVRAPWPENLRGLSRLVHELGARPRTVPLEAPELPAWIDGSRV